MSYGIIGFSQSNTLNQPSGSIWGDCQSYEMKDEGTGYFAFKDWVDDPVNLTTTSLPTIPTLTYDTSAFTIDATYAASGTSTPILPALKVATGGTAQDNAGIYTRPVVPIAPGSGQKVWFEAALALDSIVNVKGIFAGLTNLKGLTTQTSNSTGLIQTTSATLASNLITSVSGTSLIGFWSHGDILTNFDAITVNAVSGTGGLQPATALSGAGVQTSTFVGTVLQGVLTANANNPNPGNLAYVPPTPPGILTAIGTTTAGSNPSTVKLGLRYDGQQYLYFYVNGNQVAKVIVTSTNIDVTSLYGAVVVVATSTGTSYSVTVPFFRFGALLNP